MGEYANSDHVDANQAGKYENSDNLDANLTGWNAHKGCLDVKQAAMTQTRVRNARRQQQRAVVW